MSGAGGRGGGVLEFGLWELELALPSSCSGIQAPAEPHPFTRMTCPAWDKGHPAWLGLLHPGEQDSCAVAVPMAPEWTFGLSFQGLAGPRTVGACRPHPGVFLIPGQPLSCEQGVSLLWDPEQPLGPSLEHNSSPPLTQAAHGGGGCGGHSSILHRLHSYTRLGSNKDGSFLL